MTLKLIHCNIWNGGRLMDNLIAFLRQEQPDILAMQEVYDGHDERLEPRFSSMDVLTGVLGLEHRAFAATHNEPIGNSVVPCGNAILSRFPTAQKSTLFYVEQFSERLAVDGYRGNPQKPCNVMHAVLDVAARPLHVFNTHGIWGEHGRDTPHRLRMVETILQRMAGHRPAVLCGDFNVNDGTESIARLSKALVNVFAPDRRETSFNVTRKPADTGYATAVVDFIFTTPDVKVLSHRQPQVDITDHLPLICRLEVKTPSAIR